MFIIFKAFIGFLLIYFYLKKLKVFPLKFIAFNVFRGVNIMEVVKEVRTYLHIEYDALHDIIVVYFCSLYRSDKITSWGSIFFHQTRYFYLMGPTCTWATFNTCMWSEDSVWHVGWFFVKPVCEKPLFVEKSRKVVTHLLKISTAS